MKAKETLDRELELLLHCLNVQVSLGSCDLECKLTSVSGCHPRSGPLHDRASLPTKRNGWRDQQVFFDRVTKEQKTEDPSVQNAASN